MLKDSESTIRVACESDHEAIANFLKSENPFPGSDEDILSTLSDPEWRTLIRLDARSKIIGFIQGYGAEIVFIATSVKKWRQGTGKALYREYHALYSEGLPGFFLRAETGSAQNFWARMGFIQHDLPYFSTTFKRAAIVDKNDQTESITIDLFSDRGENLNIHLETLASVAERSYVLHEPFVYYVESRDHKVNISIGSKELPPRKIKYAEPYGVQIEYDRWAVIAEIPKAAVDGTAG